ncbi:hypothetical protein LRS13_13790 [Svornostia abyssi]|uniref:Uncharacterized protein n=1 Tax=Svornostia abyssi TaxID=2898438 RepID=A0ABY5PB35_9ACTN|nr:hypothetical protein LRS13_13790 [Parviterribacteraceae bacterium J379]
MDADLERLAQSQERIGAAAIGSESIHSAASDLKTEPTLGARFGAIALPFRLWATMTGLVIAASALDDDIVRLAIAIPAALLLFVSVGIYITRWSQESSLTLRLQEAQVHAERARLELEIHELEGAGRRPGASWTIEPAGHPVEDEPRERR